MRKIGVITTSRADYSSSRPILKAIHDDSDLELLLYVAAMHLAPQFGLTIKEIEADGFPIAEKVDMLLVGDTPISIAKSIGVGVLGFADALNRSRPDILLILGDRFELLSAASAALAMGIPLAHLSGGELTEGAIDNQVRYALTHLSHLHFVAMESHARRLRRCGEESWRIIVTGEPALDQLHKLCYLDQEKLESELGLELVSPVLVVTFHPATISETPVDEQVSPILAAIEGLPGTMIFTCPNVDTGYSQVLERIEAFVAEHPRAYLFASLGYLKYYSLLAIADVMVGNSSSGIWESPSFALPVVNIGERQEGRKRASNVIDVGYDAKAILETIQHALEPDFRASLAGLKNPYGDGRAVERIIVALKEVPLDHRIFKKRFVENAPER